MKLSHRLMIMLPLVMAIVAVDLATKHWAVVHLAGQPAERYWNVLTLIYSENTGAWGSLGAGWGASARALLLNFLPGLVLVGLTWHTLTGPEVEKWDALATAFILGGGLGNLVDRFQLGHVRDFLYLGIGPIGTNIFNLADTAIVVGVALMLWRMAHAPKEEPA